MNRSLFSSANLFRSAASLIRALICFTIIVCSNAVGQSQPQTTETEIWPEFDVHVQLRSHVRLLALAGVEQGIGYPFQQWYIAGAVGYQFKPILKPHIMNIDPDKEHYFILGGGYEFLRTTQSNKVKHEDRITLDATPSYLLPAGFLVRDRSWIELRWIDDVYSTTYRNLLYVERDTEIHRFRVNPYGSVEFFYDSPKHAWDQQWYTGGAQFPYKSLLLLDLYYRRENCNTCNPQNWNAAGVSVNIFLPRIK
jgi:hypothetical protein